MLNESEWKHSLFFSFLWDIFSLRYPRVSTLIWNLLAHNPSIYIITRPTAPSTKQATCLKKVKYCYNENFYNTTTIPMIHLFQAISNNNLVVQNSWEFLENFHSKVSNNFINIHKYITEMISENAQKLPERN